MVEKEILSQADLDSLLHINEFIEQKKSDSLVSEIKQAILDSGKLELKQWQALREHIAEIEELTHFEAETLFIENLNLINNFYNNKNILLTYLRLSEYNKKTEWINFLNYWINKDNNSLNTKVNLKKFKNAEDKNLSKLVELIYQNTK